MCRCSEGRSLGDGMFNDESVMNEKECAVGNLENQTEGIIFNIES
jgi:hypothetical protein